MLLELTGIIVWVLLILPNVPKLPTLWAANV